jgi:hypothetical protein
MKLILCTACNDVVKLIHEHRMCRCGKAGGRYVDDERVEVFGTNPVVLGICNNSVLRALKGRPLRGENVPLDAWVFPVQHKRIRWERAGL